MSQIGTPENPLRVAIIGAGPTGFYTAEHLFKQTDYHVTVDMYERLPVPFGLVRYGVAPDHPKIKSVTKVYDRIAENPGFRFFGNVEIGKHISVEELQTYYHQIVFTTGAQTDRRLNIPGEDLAGSLPATEFVAWYNGHPDYRNYEVNLAHENVAVVGVGNVAMDVARILCRTVEELRQTDIADYALEALSRSKVKNVYIMGRRGPAQAAFTTPEIKELGEMEDADAYVIPAEAKLDELSQAALADSSDRATMKKIEIIQSYAGREASGKSRRLTLRFLVSPLELVDDGAGNIAGMRLVKNELYATEAGSLRPRATDEIEFLPVTMVFRAIGYRGVSIPGVPFYDSWGVILNREGRILDSETQAPMVGFYTGGWIKRGPSGVIGTNKPDALETVKHMLEDVATSDVLCPEQADGEAVLAFVKNRQPAFFAYADWLRLDALEVANGEAVGRPRVKFTSVADMLVALERPLS